MQKFAIYLSIILLLFVSLYAIDAFSQRAQNSAVAEDAERLYNTKPNQLKESTKKQLKDENYQNIILPDVLADQLNNKESLFVYFFSPECVYCVATTPKLMPIASEAGVTLHQFNLLEFDKGWNQYSIQSTPTLVYFEDGKEVDRIVGGIVEGGANTKETYRQFIEKYKAK